MSYCFCFSTAESSSRKGRYSHPVLTVRRSFRIKNTGVTPVWVHGFLVEGAPCEGYGFRVLNCDDGPMARGGFGLSPEETRDIDIAFSPDFTLSLVRRSMVLWTSLGTSEAEPGLFNFTLEATVPPSLVAQCSSALPRPMWETYLYWGANCSMFLFAVGVMVAAFFESDRIVKVMMMVPLLQQQPQQPRSAENGHAAVSGGNSYLHEGPGGAGAAFDLRGIPQQVKSM